MPYANSDRNQVFGALIRGVKPIRVDPLDDDDWKLLECCWLTPDIRPSMTKILQGVQELMAKEMGEFLMDTSN